MGDISFPNIPQNIRVPLFYADIDPSNANTGQQTLRALIIGQMIAGSPGTPDQAVICQGVDATKSLSGQGSMLALMTAAYRNRDSFGEVWLLPLADDPSSTAAAGGLNFTSVPTATGVLSLYIGGQVVSLVVTPTMTLAQLATALVAQMETLPALPVTAAVDATTTTKVDFTAKNKGLAGNDIDLQLNYGGTLAGEATPAGLAVTITAMAGGATNPSALPTALANLGEIADRGVGFDDVEKHHPVAGRGGDMHRLAGVPGDVEQQPVQRRRQRLGLGDVARQRQPAWRRVIAGAGLGFVEESALDQGPHHVEGAGARPAEFLRDLGQRCRPLDAREELENIEHVGGLLDDHAYVLGLGIGRT